MSVDRILQLKLIADVSDVKKGMGQVTKQTSVVGRAFKGMASFAGPVFLNAAITGVEALSSAVLGGMEDMRKYDQALFGLTTTLKNFGVESDEAKRIAENLTTVGASLGFADDDVIVRGLQKLTTTTGSVKAGQRAMALAFDVARTKGISLEEATKLVSQGLNGSKRAMRELGIEGETTGQRLKDAEAKYGEAAEGYATTTAGTLEVVKAGIGDVFETIGATLNTELDKALPVLTQLWTDFQPTLTEIATKLGEYFAKVGELITALAPHVQAAFDLIQPLLTNLGLAFETAFAVITGVVDTITALLNGDFTGAVEAIQTTFDTVAENVEEAIGNILTFLQGIVPGILTAAGDIGAALVEGIGGAVAGLADMIMTPIRNGLNGVIGFLNGLEFPGISIEFPGVSVGNPLYGFPFDPIGKPNVELLGASTFQFLPKIDPFDIPELADGGIVTSPTLALIGEAGPEAVVPLDRMGGGVTLNMYVNGDPATVEAAVVRALRKYSSANGSVRLDGFRSLTIAR
jgi:phage-related protein